MIEIASTENSDWKHLRSMQMGFELTSVLVTYSLMYWTGKQKLI